MREFPHLVEMHKKYAKDGFAAVSVSLDPPADTGKVTAFLEKREAKFTNLLLDESDTDWQAKLKIDGPPLIAVYDRDGKEVMRAQEYEGVEKLVVELLQKK